MESGWSYRVERASSRRTRARRQDGRSARHTPGPAPGPPPQCGWRSLVQVGVDDVDAHVAGPGHRRTSSGSRRRSRDSALGVKRSAISRSRLEQPRCSARHLSAAHPPSRSARRRGRRCRGCSTSVPDRYRERRRRGFVRARSRDEDVLARALLGSVCAPSGSGQLAVRAGHRLQGDAGMPKIFERLLQPPQQSRFSHRCSPASDASGRSRACGRSLVDAGVVLIVPSPNGYNPASMERFSSTAG